MMKQPNFRLPNSMQILKKYKKKQGGENESAPGAPGAPNSLPGANTVGGPDMILESGIFN
jgi:hypothetical protein